jgi:hypothetical protein
VDQLRTGRLPLRVTLNDTKLNNVLMDEGAGRAPVRHRPGHRHAGAERLRLGDASAVARTPPTRTRPIWTRCASACPCTGLTARVTSPRPEKRWSGRACVPGDRRVDDDLRVRLPLPHRPSGRGPLLHVAYPGHNLIRAKNQFAC